MLSCVALSEISISGLSEYSCSCAGLKGGGSRIKSGHENWLSLP